MRGKAGFLTDLDRGGKEYDKAKDEANKNVQKLRQLFGIMPSVREMLDSSTNEESLREFLVAKVGYEQGKDLY